VEQPLLIDGTAFDIGVYVLLEADPQTNQLQAHIFNDVLLR
jgi:hypothetical protein